MKAMSMLDYVCLPFVPVGGPQPAVGRPETPKEAFMIRVQQKMKLNLSSESKAMGQMSKAGLKTR